MANDLQKNMKILFKNTSIVFIIRIFGMGLGFFLQFILGRILGADSYGQYTIFITIINLFGLLTVLGIDMSLIRTIPRIDKEDKLKYKLLDKSIIVVILLSIMVGALLLTFRGTILSIFEISNNEYYIVIPILLLLTSVSKIIDGFLQGDRKTIIAITLTTLVSNLLKLVIFFVVYYISRGSLFSAIMSYLVSEILLVSIRALYVVINKKSNSLTKNTVYSSYQYRNFLFYSFSLFAIAGVDTFIHSIDKMVINFFSNSANVGMYKVSENYLSLLSVFVSPFVVFWPMISKIYQNGQLDILNKIFGYVVKIISILSLPMVVFMIIFSKDLLNIFGSEYIVGFNIFYVLLLGVAFDAIAGPVGALLNMTDYAKFNLINTIVMAVVDLILNLVLVPKYGAIGAALATSISLILITIASIIENKIFLKIFPYDRGNFYFLICSIITFFIGKILYNIIFINIYFKMILFLILNYLIFVISFTLIAKPKYKEIYTELSGRK